MNVSIEDGQLKIKFDKLNGDQLELINKGYLTLNEFKDNVGNMEAKESLLLLLFREGLDETEKFDCLKNSLIEAIKTFNQPDGSTLMINDDFEFEMKDRDYNFTNEYFNRFTPLIGIISSVQTTNSDELELKVLNNDPEIRGREINKDQVETFIKKFIEEASKKITEKLVINDKSKDFVVRKIQDSYENPSFYRRSTNLFHEIINLNFSSTSNMSSADRVKKDVETIYDLYKKNKIPDTREQLIKLLPSYNALDEASKSKALQAKEGGSRTHYNAMELFSYYMKYSKNKDQILEEISTKFDVDFKVCSNVLKKS